jgi:Raf kinase inhibitor-like YbhB/YbcL family protein
MRQSLAVTAALALAIALVGGGCADTTRPSPASSAADSASSPAATSAALTVTSDAFTDGGTIPAAYTCSGAGRVPTIAWSGDLRGAVALAVVVDDPDAPGGTFVHRIVLDLPATTTSLGTELPTGAHEAENSAGQTGWYAPCPPSGTHHYRFTVYGLKSRTGLPAGAATADALNAINARTVVQGRLVGLVSS